MMLDNYDKGRLQEFLQNIRANLVASVTGGEA